MKRKMTLCATLLLLITFACEQNDQDVKKLEQVDDSPIFRELSSLSPNGRVAAPNSRYAILMAEYLTTEESGQLGRTVYFKNVGNKRLAGDFVPGLSEDGTDDISYYIDQSRPSADLPVTVTSAAIDRAMETWDEVQCSDLGIYKVPYDPSIQTGFISNYFGYGGSDEYVADVVHAGWLPASFFDLLAPEGSTFILAVTFTIVYTDAEGNLVDTDNNKRYDVAWREIYYNDAFTWADGATYDVETIALHESGHALSQEHFGTAFRDAGGQKLHFAPRAVMNAAYSGVQTEISKTDNGGHCSNWANWPNK
jgi:hypothetical protein